MYWFVNVDDNHSYVDGVLWTVPHPKWRHINSVLKRVVFAVIYEV
jgi:hypothetical protein